MGSSPRPALRSSGWPMRASSLLDLAAQGLRRQVQLFAGPHQATGTYHGMEITQVFVVHRQFDFLVRFIRSDGVYFLIFSEAYSAIKFFHANHGVERRPQKCSNVPSRLWSYPSARAWRSTTAHAVEACTDRGELDKLDRALGGQGRAPSRSQAHRTRRSAWLGEIFD